MDSMHGTWYILHEVPHPSHDLMMHGIWWLVVVGGWWLDPYMHVCTILAHKRSIIPHQLPPKMGT